MSRELDRSDSAVVDAVDSVEAAGSEGVFFEGVKIGRGTWRWIQVIGIFELFDGGISLLFYLGVGLASNLGWYADLTIFTPTIAFYVFGIICGSLLLRKKKLGVTLSLVRQAMCIPIVMSPVFWFNFQQLIWLTFFMHINEVRFGIDVLALSIFLFLLKVRKKLWKA